MSPGVHTGRCGVYASLGGNIPVTVRDADGGKEQVSRCVECLAAHQAKKKALREPPAPAAGAAAAGAQMATALAAGGGGDDDEAKHLLLRHLDPYRRSQVILQYRYFKWGRGSRTMSRIEWARAWEDTLLTKSELIRMFDQLSRMPEMKQAHGAYLAVDGMLPEEAHGIIQDAQNAAAAALLAIHAHEAHGSDGDSAPEDEVDDEDSDD